MTPDERDRLVRLETKQDQILENLSRGEKRMSRIELDLSAIKIGWAKMGGALIAVSMIGAAIGWILTNIKNWMGVTG